MKKASKCISIVALALLLIPASRIAAVEGEFSGQVLTGFRLVDIGGADRKYKEDLNLDDGPRLFDLRMEFVPGEGFRNAVDRVNVDLDNFGGDPFEAMRIGVRKHGAYKFDYKRTKSNYFYNDIILPKEDVEDISKAQAGDFHHFNFDRIRDTATLGMNFNQNFKGTFGFERYTKAGESTTSLDIRRDEFEFDKPIHESMNTYKGGIEYSRDNMTLVFEERVKDYDNMSTLFLPGYSVGEDPNPPDAEILDFFTRDQPYDFMNLEHNLRVMYQPMDDLDVRLATSFQSLDLDTEVEEESQGLSYNTAFFNNSASGGGEIDRSLNLIDFDATYALMDKISVNGGVRHQKLDQEGELTLAGSDYSVLATTHEPDSGDTWQAHTDSTFTRSTFNMKNLGDWDIKTTGFEFGAEVFVSPKITLHGGVLYEKRETDILMSAQMEESALDTLKHIWSDDSTTIEVDEETDDETAADTVAVETKNTGFFGGAAWKPIPAFDLNVDIEINSFDDPFTLASPTDRKRYRVKGHYRLDNGLSFTGSYLFKDYENDNSMWTADNKQLNLRCGYGHSKASVSFGFGMVTSDRKIDQSITGGSRTRVANILFEVDSKFVDGRASVKAHKNASLGMSYRYYKNDGSFGITRNDVLTWIEMTCKHGYVVNLSYQRVDFDESDFDFDDYDANIGRIAIGYKW
jgi:hypothetical protein